MLKQRKDVTVIMTLAALLLSVGAITAHAQECVNSRCHSGMGTAEFVHGPVVVGQCVICHTSGNPKHPTGSAGEDFILQAQGKELCYLCHEPMDSLRVVHDPVRKGNCIFCHDPHQSNAEKRLKRMSISQLCFICHEDNKTGKNVVHQPVAAGDCIICHDPHSTSYEGLVKLEGAEQCFLCHLDRRERFELKYKHEPAADGCSDCHDAHATDFSSLLFSDVETLCLDCHSEIENYLKRSSVKHSALNQENCTACHTVHASNYPLQLKGAVREICYLCHKDMETRVKKSMYLHGPVAQDDCYACHDSHGSNYPNILKKAFPPEFYIPYAAGTYALCFECHDSDIFLDRFTTTSTGFRNGEQNLHYLHTNREKGISCYACHEIHAGNQAKHIRREVPFGGGGWMLQVNFSPNRNGGSCVVGCHKPKDYDRIDPVEY